MTKKEKIDEVIRKHDHIFRNREDFVEGRTSWQDLADIADDFYFTLISIRDGDYDE